jgi:hypothetical protein
MSATQPYSQSWPYSGRHKTARRDGRAISFVGIQRIVEASDLRFATLRLASLIACARVVRKPCIEFAAQDASFSISTKSGRVNLRGYCREALLEGPPTD